MNYQESTYILSAFKSNLPSDTNLSLHSQLNKLLHCTEGVVIPAIGKYQGIQELSFITSQISQDYIEFLANRFSQESYLEVDRHNIAYLNYLDNRASVVLGRLKEVSSTHKGDYTKNLITGKYYAVF